MDPVSIPAVKELIRSISARDVRKLATDILKLSSAAEIEEKVATRLLPLLPELSSLQQAAPKPRPARQRRPEA
jgi:signal transduction protein with GAF and PtsI domain